MTDAPAVPKDEKKSLSESLMEKIDAENLVDAAKGKIDAALHYTGETHGKREDIDEKKALDELKAPDVFGRVIEDIEALAVTGSAKSDEITGNVKDKFIAIGGDAKGDDKTFEPIKIKVGTLLHDRETHGTSSDINEDTPIDAVKAPGIYQRAKEEIEALVGTIHLKIEPSPNTEEGGFRAFIAKLLQKVCQPWDSKKEESKSD